MNYLILESIECWQRAAEPEPNQYSMSKGLGYFLEEINETIKSVKLDPDHDHLRKDLWFLMEHIANSLKQGQAIVMHMDREKVVDGLADTIVTAVGFGYRAGMDVPKATALVDENNWDKFVDGKPLKDEHGKVIKPEGWRPVSLKECV